MTGIRLCQSPISNSPLAEKRFDSALATFSFDSVCLTCDSAIMSISSLDKDLDQFSLN